MAMSTLTSRAAQILRPQIRTATTTTTTTLSLFHARTYFSQQNCYYYKTLVSSIPAARRALSSTLLNASNNNKNNIANPLTTINQIRSFSASATLAGKRATYNPSRRVQKRRHGFLARLRTRTGRLILKRRRLKGRKDLSW